MSNGQQASVDNFDIKLENLGQNGNFPNMFTVEVNGIII